MAQIAQTILDQLGGRMFRIMTGCKSALACNEGRGLSLRIGGGMFVKIVLNASDLYDIEVFKLRNAAPVARKSAGNVYAEDLRREFTALTGMYCSM